MLFNFIYRKLSQEMADTINDSDDHIALLDDQYRDCCCECCCSEDICYGLTFLGRLVLTLYSFQALFFLYNFIINYILLLPGMLYFTDNSAVIFLVFLVYVFFAGFCSNLLIIPTYELLQFNFLRYKNCLCHLQSLRITKNIIHGNDSSDEKINFKESNIIVNILLILIEIAYIIGFILGFFHKTMVAKDIIREIIYIIIYFYYLVIFFGYFFVSLDLKINLWLEMKDSNKDRRCCCLVNTYIYFDEYINDFFHDKPSLPNINLLCYAINPILDDSYKAIRDDDGNCCCCENWFYLVKNIIRPIAFILSFIVAIYIAAIQNSKVYVYFILIFFYLFAYVVSSMLNFPYVLRNIKLICCCSTKYEYKGKYKLGHPIIVAFTRLISFIIIIFVSFGLLIVYLAMDEGDNLSSIRELGFNPIPETKNTTKLKPNICFSSIHEMYIHLFLPFINDAYYYNSNPKIAPDFYSSFQIPGYKGLFFDDTYDIDVKKGNLVESDDINNVKMIQYDVTKYKIEDGIKTVSRKITILAIKGTTNKKDIFLDAQLYLPSLLLNWLTFFSIFAQNKETYSFGFLEYSLGLPYRLFSQYLIIDGYLQELIKAYKKHSKDFNPNIIIVGHSLGGGLAKLLGRFLGKQAISLSGPGVNAFHSLWDYEGSSDDFEISAIDLVPDMDLIPRVEVSGGTIYRIVCKEGMFKCHDKELSLCEVLVMCRNPNYEQYCKKMEKLEHWQVKAIIESSEL